MVVALVLGVLAWLAPRRAGAAAPSTDAVPTLSPAPDLGPLLGRPIVRVEVVTAFGRWAAEVKLRRVRLGDPFSGELSRRAMQELADSGRYAEISAEAVPEANGVVLRLHVLPRRIVTAVRIQGGVLGEDETLGAAGVQVGDEVTAPALSEMAARIRAFYVRSGYPEATVDPDAIDTDEAMRVILVFQVRAGRPRLVSSRTLRLHPAPSEALSDVADRYAVDAGDRADEEQLLRADREEQEALRKAGWLTAEVAHRVDEKGRLVVDLRAGPHVRIRFEGNHEFDDAALTDALELEESDDRTPATLASAIEKFYVERGFFDVRVVPETRGKPADVENDLVLHVYEGSVVRVVAREFPCLTGERSADDVGSEIDSFLSEALPGTGLFGAVDPKASDSALGPKNVTGARVSPHQANPWRTYVPEVYERATRHLTELYRSEGYLSATVGPVVAMRRACDPRSPPGTCRPIGERIRPPVRCPATDTELPSEDPPPPPACTPSPGVRCEPDVVLHIPVKLGPRAVLWDASYEGNRELVEAELAKIAELPLGEPVSQIELERARRRLLDEYAERGYAFATVELHVELSPDHTRARAHFTINERERVRVKDIVVRGAHRTNESLILRRIAFDKGDVYRRSDVRATEQRLATLGVFSSVTVELEDPEVFAKEKVVVVTVHEQVTQYVEPRAGFSTGDGFRLGLEYGHRNVGGEAIRLTARIMLNILPDFVIFEPEVRARFSALPLYQRLERRDSLEVEFPEVGLGPLFPFEVTGLDVRDNSRDFGLTKEAGIVTLSYRPTTRFVTQVGGSVELNDAKIFASDESLAEYIAQNPGASFRLRVPDGKTVAIAERTNVTWDRRDDPFDATQGTFVSASVEHVHADPVGNGATITSEFLRLQNRIAGYLRLSHGGLALALSFRWGYNIQLNNVSQTYPDRLFYFGGVDSIRGFIQDSVIPEDLAQRILGDRKKSLVDDRAILTADSVAIRGGNVVLNPRAELRIPLAGVLQTALFFDTGNVWLDPRSVDPTRLRYAAGTGIRAVTPVGPLALDIGFNLDKRPWEDPFAFHFSIGLF